MNEVFAVCTVTEVEREAGWGTNYSTVGILVATSGTFIEDKKKELSKRDTPNFYYEYSGTSVHRIGDPEIARPINEEDILFVCNKDRVKMIREALKPF